MSDFMISERLRKNVLSFVKNVRTKDGGTHESGSKTAITRKINDESLTYSNQNKNKEVSGTILKEMVTEDQTEEILNDADNIQSVVVTILSSIKYIDMF
jgi:DNA gyrase/topoisomerase IV subunit B